MFNLDEDEIKDSGIKVRGLRPRPAPPKTEPKSEPELAPLLSAMRQMTAAIEAAIAKRGEAPNITVKAPDVTVESPRVTVQAPEAPKPLLEWEGEITQRDTSGRMKKFRLRAIV